MRSKQQTPLGFLMGLLNVSLADLGDYLFVAQTTISKWRTGARTLKPVSHHFAGIVEYFVMLARDPERRDKMIMLFEKLYPEQPLQSPEDIAQCVRAFLGGKLLPSMAVHQSLQNEERLYTTEVGVYSGEAGSRAAFAQVLDFLTDHPALEMASICRGEALPLARLVPALSQGHRLRLLLDPPSPADMLSDRMGILAHPDADVRLLAGDAPFPRGASFLAVEDGPLLVGNTLPGQPAYASLRTDPLTLAQYRGIFAACWEATEAAFACIAHDQVHPELLARAARTTLTEPLDWLLPSLPCVTMSRELLMEVLRANSVSGRAWRRVLDMCDQLALQPMRLFVPVQGLLAAQDTLPLLSLLCGQPVRLTPAQAKRHQLDTAAMLRADAALSIVPVQREPPAVWADASAFIKPNAFAGYIDLGRYALRWTASPALLEAMGEAMRELASRCTAQAMQPAYIAGQLESAALSPQAAHP